MNVWGKPVAGARIALVGTSLSAVTDGAGAFDIQGHLPSTASNQAAPAFFPDPVRRGKVMRAIVIPDSTQMPDLTMRLWPFAPPREEIPVDLARWAYVYRKNAMDNPPETQLMKPSGDMLCGLSWEERRAVRRIEVEFSDAAGYVLDSNKLKFLTRSGYVLVQTSSGGDVIPAGDAVTTSRGTSLFSLRASKDINCFLVLCSDNSQGIGIPLVHAYGTSTWSKPLTVEIEWSFSKRQGRSTLGRLGRSLQWLYRQD